MLMRGAKSSQENTAIYGGCFPLAYVAFEACKV